MTDAMIPPVARDHYYYEALRFCDERDIPHDCAESIAYSMRHRAFMEAVQPYLKVRTDVLGLATRVVTKIIFHKNGRTDTVWPDLSEEQKALLAKMDEIIAYTARQYGVEWSLPHD